MADKTNNNKVIAKNTMFLYVRMLVIMLIKLYTTRVLLKVLGTDDFGIWNVVYGAVIAFSFINAPIVTATQRFLNYDQGKGGMNQSKIFSTSLILTSIAAILLIIFFETVGLKFFKDRLDIPAGAELSALIVYQCCIGILVVNFIRLPFESIIISQERFSFYAIISFVESVLLLGLIIVLKLLNSENSLQLYGIFSLITAILLLMTYIIYCNIKFKEIRFETKLDRDLLKDIGKFSGWNTFGAISTVLAGQGINVLFNMFYGVAVNAAYGISMQVTGAFILVTGNLIKAANPRIVKTYAAGDYDEVMQITFNISKYSFLLIFSISYILINYINVVLSIWLGFNVPEYTNIFCIFSIMYILIVCLSSPTETVIFATGKIKNYQILISGVILLNFIFAYIALKFGMSPVVVLVIKCFVELLVLTVRIVYIKFKVGYNAKSYIHNVILPSTILVLFSIIFMEIVKVLFCNKQDIHNMILYSIIYMPVIILICWYVYLPKVKRNILINKIKDYRNLIS